MFTEESTLEEVLEFHGAEDVLLKFNVPCLGCPMVKMEMSNLTIGQICVTYGINKKELLTELNTAAANYRKQ